jgi:hypothetical protein
VGRQGGYEKLYSRYTLRSAFSSSHEWRGLMSRTGSSDVKTLTFILMVHTRGISKHITSKLSRNSDLYELSAISQIEQKCKATLSFQCILCSPFSLAKTEEV